jgi:biopolymer transport protein ExbD
MSETPEAQLPPSVKKSARIEIIPLIDVIFFLLATFVLFTLSLNKIQSMDAKLPVSTPVKKNDDTLPPMIIQASEGEVVFIDQVPRSITDVYSAVVQYKEDQEKASRIPRVLVAGDDSAKYGNLVKIIDYVKSAGITEMSIETIHRPTGK